MSLEFRFDRVASRVNPLNWIWFCFFGWKKDSYAYLQEVSLFLERDEHLARDIACRVLGHYGFMNG